MKPALQPSLKARALRLISMREHSRTELVRKLARFEEQPGSLLLALDDLQAKGLISEQRVIASVLHRQAGKFGGARIRQALQALGLESEAIGLAIGSLQGSEAERAQAVWQKNSARRPPMRRPPQNKCVFCWPGVSAQTLPGASSPDLTWHRRSKSAADRCAQLGAPTAPASAACFELPRHSPPCPDCPDARPAPHGQSHRWPPGWRTPATPCGWCWPVTPRQSFAHPWLAAR